MNTSVCSFPIEFKEKETVQLQEGMEIDKQYLFPLNLAQDDVL